MTETNTPGSLETKLPFVIMAKPVGSICNMRCTYCYYLETEYGDSAPHVMSDDVLEAFIRGYIHASPGPNVSFTWHGGEPALAGIPFYEKVITLQDKYLPEGYSVINNLQTNGTLLHDAFCDFLAEHHFDVGLSIDGTRLVHDKNRRYADGSATYTDTLDAVRRLLERGIRPDLLCTVHQDTLPYAKEVYRALRDLGTGWMQFIPITNPAPRSITGAEYGKFLTQVFTEWFYHDLGKVNVQLFAETARMLAGGAPSLCTLSETCGQVLVVEYDGSIYACDHYVDAAHRLGNVITDDLQTLLQNERQLSFGRRKADELADDCRACPYLSLCHAGCPKDRVPSSNRNILCDGFKAYFDIAVPHLRCAIELSSQHVSPSAIMTRLKEEAWAPYRKVGRNDLCPCGSGKKFKNCHMPILP